MGLPLIFLFVLRNYNRVAQEKVIVIMKVPTQKTLLSLVIHHYQTACVRL